MSHFRTVCRVCQTLMATCRCPGDKETNYQTCPACLAQGKGLVLKETDRVPPLCGQTFPASEGGYPVVCARPSGHDGGHAGPVLPMEWGRLRRETGLVEHTCAHGVGHPNHGSAMWLAQAIIEARKLGDWAGPEPEEEVPFEEGYGAWLVHGCDGCCSRDDFPGTLESSLRYANGLLRAVLDERKKFHEQRKRLRDLLRSPVTTDRVRQAQHLLEPRCSEPDCERTLPTPGERAAGKCEECCPK